MTGHHVALFQRVALTAVSRLKQQQQQQTRNTLVTTNNVIGESFGGFTPHLPLEILERILDFLYDDKNSLLACSLVCHAIFPTSRYHLSTLLPVLPDILAEGCHKVNTAVLLERGLALYGSTDGIYLSQSNFIRLLKLPCTQIDALESNDMLLILSGRRLLLGPLHLAVGPHANPVKLREQLEVLSEASFFKVGEHAGKRVICIVNAGRFSSHFKVLEAVPNTTESKTKPLSTNLIPFRSFYLPDLARDVHIFNKTIGAALRTGFQCVDPLSLVTFAVPVSSQAATLPEESAGAGPRKCRAMFRVDDARFLLCYDRCAFFMDKAGNSSESTFAIRWPQNAKRLVFVAGSRLLLAFFSGGMHAWRIDTGKLVQSVWDREGIQMLCTTPEVVVKMGDGRIVRLKIEGS